MSATLPKWVHLEYDSLSMRYDRLFWFEAYPQFHERLMRVVPNWLRMGFILEDMQIELHGTVPT